MKAFIKFAGCILASQLLLSGVICFENEPGTALDIAPICSGRDLGTDECCITIFKPWYIEQPGSSVMGRPRIISTDTSKLDSSYQAAKFKCYDNREIVPVRETRIRGWYVLLCTPEYYIHEFTTYTKVETPRKKAKCMKYADNHARLVAPGTTECVDVSIANAPRDWLKLRLDASLSSPAVSSTGDGSSSSVQQPEYSGNAVKALDISWSILDGRRADVTHGYNTRRQSFFPVRRAGKYRACATNAPGSRNFILNAGIALSS